MSEACHFCKKIGKTASVNKEFCGQAFISTYPEYLAMLYDGIAPEKKVFVHCGHSACSGVWEVNSKRQWYWKWLKVIEVICRRFGRPVDFPDRIVTFRLIESWGLCVHGYLDTIVRKTYDSEFCPQAAFTCLPFGSDVQFCCPSDKQRVTFKTKE
jgi:hypothetical protein